jgi:hypothetical protein
MRKDETLNCCWELNRTVLQTFNFFQIKLRNQRTEAIEIIQWCYFFIHSNNQWILCGSKPSLNFNSWNNVSTMPTFKKVPLFWSPRKRNKKASNLKKITLLLLNWLLTKMKFEYKDILSTKLNWSPG